MILSYHPMLGGDVSKLCAGRNPDEQDLADMRKASAILLPQGKHEKLYTAATSNCTHVFPNYDCRYTYPGKIGDVGLFKELDLPHPRTYIFASAESCPFSFWTEISYPLVLKHNHGGEGQLVFLVRTPQQARSVLDMYRRMEKSGFSGFLAQEFIQTDSRTLRVAIMGERYYSYWRVQPDKHNFLHSIRSGARIDQNSDPQLQKQGIELVKKLVHRSGINLAGIDLLFQSEKNRLKGPFLLEINYFFARKGLGGSHKYYQLLQGSVDEWLEKRGLHYQEKR